MRDTATFQRVPMQRRDGSVEPRDESSRNTTEPGVVRYHYLLEAPGVDRPASQGTVSVDVAVETDPRDDVSGAGPIFGFQETTGDYFAFVSTAGGYAPYPWRDTGVSPAGSPAARFPCRAAGVPRPERSTTVHTTNYVDTFIEVAEDCPVEAAVAPPERRPATVARLQYDALIDAPYRYTSDDVVFGVHAARAGVAETERDAARAAFFSKGQPCLRSSPLAKAYGWGFHFDANGKVALVPLGSSEYAKLAATDGLHHKRAMRRTRAR